MKIKFCFIEICLLAGTILFCRCTKDEKKDDKTNPTPPPVTQEKNKYTVAASYGDIISYELNNTSKTYTYSNETTGQSGSGSYVVSSNSNLTGIYEISSGGNTYYAIELAKKIMATTVPSGRTENKLCFGITADQNLATSYTTSDLSGKYLFLDYGAFDDGNVLGGYQLNENGTFSWNYAPHDVALFNPNTHFTGLGSGTWSISSSDASRISYTENNQTFQGSILPGKLMLIDNGMGNGFTVGIKYPETHITQASIAGTYRYLDIMSNGEIGVGWYSLPASGQTINYYYKYNGSSGEGTGSLNTFVSIPQINNVFKATDVQGSETYDVYFMVLPGEVMLYFCLEVNAMNLISYGIGAKIN